NAPSGTIVARDGVLLQAASLDTALPTQPGAHAIVVRAPGRQEQRFDLTMAEGEARELEVAPGPSAAPPPVPPEATTTTSDTPAPASSASSSSSSSSGVPWRTIGLVTAGAGVIGVGIGSVLALEARADRCPDNVCADQAAKSKHLGARANAQRATVAFAVGG